jgi:hypothetical protein
VAPSAVGALTKSHTNGTGWALTGVVDKKAGFGLEDITHDGHWFADSISVERIAVASFSDLDYRRPRDNAENYHVFGLGNCKVLSAPSVVDLPTGTTDPLGYYAPRVKLAATYRMPDLLKEKGQQIDLELAYLLTPYNKDPSHEPGGVLSAARLYPTLTFNIPSTARKEKSSRMRYPTAVQAVFRINMRFEDRGVGNQCAIFVDNEELGPLGVGLSGLWGKGRPGEFIFKRAEKPVLYEVCGRGVRHGSHFGWSSKEPGWDNIHQWSHPSAPGLDSPNDGFKNQPLTPGLPYGGHMHWRWGLSATTGRAVILPGGKQYAGPGGPGKPLIDARIYNQNIEFAIVDGSEPLGDKADLLDRLDRDPVSFLFRDFSNVWQDIRPVPELLMPSANLVIWVTVIAWGPGWNGTQIDYEEFFGGSGLPADVERPAPKYYTREWGGTLFAHGLFFPHDDLSDLPLPPRLLPGAKKAQYLPGPPQQTWRRTD